MPNTSGRWKQHEREWAAWAGGHRIPSQGVSKEDIMANDESWGAEHKTTKRLPVWLNKALYQRRDIVRRTGLPAYIFVSVAPGQGSKIIRLLVGEVDFNVHDAPAEFEKLNTMGVQIVTLGGRE